MTIEKLKVSPPEQTQQVTRRVIRRLEDDAVVALMLGDERLAMEITAKIEALEAASSELDGADSASKRRARRMFRKG